MLISLGISCSVVPAAEVESTTANEEANASSDNYFKFGGYVRTWLSFNLDDQPETVNYDDSWKPQMERLSLSLNSDAKTGPIIWRAVVRSDQEALTPYEKRLQNQLRKDFPGGPGNDLLGQYRQTQLREFYGESDIGDRIHLRLGRQQIVWGETDFFHPTDLIQGFDYRWRSFLEAESDELRKPLILANLKINVPEAAGSLQVVVRPGLDRQEDIGNTYSAFGGRWAEQPFKAVDFLQLTGYDYEHPAGKYKTVTGGLRWTGFAGPVNYAFSWLKTFNPDPVLNPTANPYQTRPSGILGSFFYPTIEVYAASISGEVAAIDTVANAEIAYQTGKLYNTGISSTGLAGAVTKKDLVQTTIRLDKQFRFMDALGTNAPSLASLQLFDTWLQSFKKSDEIVENLGYALPMREHTSIATAFIGFPYMNGRLNPGIAVGRYLQAHDTFAIPSISYNYGNHWRFSAEADLFFTSHQNTLTSTDPSTDTLGVLAKSDQFLLRATYQF
jgi:hypothetical protein